MSVGNPEADMEFQMLQERKTLSYYWKYKNKEYRRRRTKDAYDKEI